MARPRSEGRLGVFGFERGDFPGLAVIDILQKGKISFYVRNIDVLSVGRKKHAVSFLFTFVHCGDGFAGDAHVVKRIDVEPPVSVTDPEQVSVFLVEAHVAGPVVEIHIMMLQVGTILI